MAPPFSAYAEELRAGLGFDPARSRKLRQDGWWTPDTLGSLLAARASGMPQRTTIVGDGETLTYREAARRADRLASWLRGHGVAKGEVVAVQLVNSPEYLLAHLGVARAGAVLTTIHMSYRTAEVANILRHSRARVAICMREFKDYRAAAVTASLQKELPHLQHIVVVGGVAEGLIPFIELVEADAAGDPLDIPQASDPFMLLYTSGTSDRPKAAPHTYETLLSNARVTAEEFGITENDRILGAGPYSHLYQLFGFHMSLYCGASNVILPAFSADGLGATVERARATVLFAVPAHIASCLNDGIFERFDCTSIRLAFIAGSAVPPDLVRALALRLPRAAIVQLWGMTEMQAGLYTRPGDPIDLVARSCGRPSPGTEVRIVDDSGAELPSGVPGELQVRGSSVFAGYFRNEEANSEAFAPEGWFRTGDLAVRDEAGNVTISGRIKDIINRGGVKYSPRDIEDVLQEHPKIRQVAIVPMPDPVLGEKACCFVVPAAGDEPTLEEICSYLAARGIAKHKLPERLELLEEMPVGPTRKTLKEELKRRLVG